MVMAERQGFEPWIEFPLYTLSKRAPSTTRPSLRFSFQDSIELLLDDGPVAFFDFAPAAVQLAALAAFAAACAERGILAAAFSSISIPQPGASLA